MSVLLRWSCFLLVPCVWLAHVDDATECTIIEDSNGVSEMARQSLLYPCDRAYRRS